MEHSSVGGISSSAGVERILLDDFAEILWVGSFDGNVHRFNRQWFAYTGQRLEDGLDAGERLRLAVHPRDAETAIQAWTQGIERGEPFWLELRLRRFDGDNRWFRASVSPLRSGNANGSEWLAVCTDVDDHKRQGERFAFLARSSEALSESLDLQTTLERMLAIVVPELADWAAIDLFDETGRLKTVAAIHAYPEKAALVQRIVGRYNHDLQAEPLIEAELRKNQAIVIPNIPDESIERSASHDLIDVIRALAPHSTVTVPLKSRGGTIGSLVAFWAETPRRYSHDDVPLFKELTRRAAVAIENARLYEREREIATEFQRAALPSSLPSVPGIRFDGIYVPASDRALLGGDWYDALRLSDGRIVVSIGDVAGSGLSAAVIMASMRQVIRGVAQVYADPVAMLDAADRTLKTEHPNMFVTAFVGVFDPITRTLTYASAGHPPPLLRDSDGGVRALSGGSPPIGLRMRGDEAMSITLPEDCLLVFYTDGVIEVERDVIAGQERLQAAVAAADIPSMPNCAEALYKRLLERGSSDDVVILTLRLVSPGPAEPASTRPSIRWTFDTSDAETAHRARHAFVQALRDGGMSEDDTGTAELIFGELLGNVVRYAPGPIDITFDWNDEMPVLHVLDRGPGFTLVPRLPTDLLSERGRGLYIVWSLAEDFNVTERFDGGSHARAVLGPR
ncbi:MAG TPA: SpoIIE family protein phosphatase [Candidatus Tumulicola sp.]|jgi:PAS domain S-box-containing protein